MSRPTEDPQTVDSPIADTEWKVDPGVHPIIHGAGDTVRVHFPDSADMFFPFKADEMQGSSVNRSNKAASPPEVNFSHHGDIAGGTGSRGIKGWTGDGKGGHELKSKKDI
jgi:hypothetical protein